MCNMAHSYESNVIILIYVIVVYHFIYFSQISWSYFIIHCVAQWWKVAVIFSDTLSLPLTRTVKVILNTCLWSTAPDDCQLSPTLSICPFDSQTHIRTRTHTCTYTRRVRVRDYWLTALTDWILASQTQTCLCVTQLDKIWLVRAHQRVQNDSNGSVLECVYLKHTHIHTLYASLGRIQMERLLSFIARLIAFLSSML